VSVTSTGETWTEKHAAVARAYAKKTLALIQFVFGPRFGWRFVLGSLLLTQLAMLTGFTAAVVVRQLDAAAPALGVIAAQFGVLLLARFWRPTWPLVAYGLSWSVLLSAGAITMPMVKMLTFPAAMTLGVMVDILVVAQINGFYKRPSTLKRRMASY